MRPGDEHFDTTFDKVLDLAQITTTGLFNLMWRLTAWRHRLEELGFISMEHAQVWLDEAYALAHSRSLPPEPGSRASQAFQMISGSLCEGDVGLATVHPLHAEIDEDPA
jgi:hypothetical protein